MWQRGNEIIFQMENTQMGKMPSLFSSFFFPFICLNCVNYAWEIFQTAAFLLTSVCRAVWWIVCSLSQCYLPPIPTAGKKKKKKRKSGASVAGSCQLYLPPRPFWSPPVWDFTEWRRVMHKHGRTQRDALTHTNSRQESQKKNCERDKKQTGARNSRNTNPTGTHTHPSIRLLRTYPRGL